MLTCAQTIDTHFVHLSGFNCTTCLRKQKPLQSSGEHPKEVEFVRVVTAGDFVVDVRNQELQSTKAAILSVIKNCKKRPKSSTLKK
jgi:hypothetical protein